MVVAHGQPGQLHLLLGAVQRQLQDVRLLQLGEERWVVGGRSWELLARGSLQSTGPCTRTQAPRMGSLRGGMPPRAAQSLTCSSAALRCTSADACAFAAAACCNASSTLADHTLDIFSCSAAAAERTDSTCNAAEGPRGQQGAQNRPIRLYST